MVSKDGFRTLFELAADALFIVEPDGLIREINQVAHQRLGYAREEMVGRNIGTLILPEFAAKLEQRFEKVHLNGFHVYESAQVRKDGSILPVEVCSREVEIDGKTLIFSIVRDISERKRLYEELRASEERFRTLAADAPEAIVIHDLDTNKFVDVSVSAEKLFGYSREEMLRHGPAFFYAPEQPEESPSTESMVERGRRIMAGEHMKFERVIRNGNGQDIHCEVTLVQLPAKDRRLVRGSFVDITQRKQAERALQESEEKWRQLFENMTSGFALHEVLCDEQGKVVDYRFLEVNPAYEKLTGLMGYRIIGHTVLEVLPGTESYWIDIFGRVAMTREPTSYENYSRELGRWYGVRAFSPKRGQFAVIVNDITDRKEEQRIMEMMKFSMDHLADKVTWVTSDARVVYANHAACSSLEYTMDEMLKLSIPDFDPDFSAEVWPQHWQELKKYGSFTFESRHRTKSGRIYPVEVSINYMRFGDKEYNCGIARDITARKRIEQERQLSAMILENSSEGMVVTNEDNLIVAINPAFTHITGYSFDDVAGKSPAMFRSGRQDDEFYRAMWHEINTTGHWQGEIWDRRKDGAIQAKWLSINTIRNEDGSVHRYVALFSDITKKKMTEELVWRQANFDALTDLPNREMFRDRIDMEMKKSDREGGPVALLLIDLDHFKEVNDTLGHAYGDMLLKEAAQRIRVCVRESDTVARLGGDEFIVVLSTMHDMGNIEQVAQKIIARLSEPFRLGGELAYVSASIGITLYPDDATSIDALMKNADQAMYAAKNEGRNRFSYFTHELQAQAQARLRMINDLRSAIETSQFHLHFQPIVDLTSGQVCKGEALIRWEHPQRGMVSPAEFIPVAEESGLIREIGDWVFMESVRWVRQFSKYCSGKFQLSVNISPLQFQHGFKAGDEWMRYFEMQQISGDNIVIEITEGVLLNAEDGVAERLLKFRDEGIQVAIDDFGTGYSSLSYLKKFDIDYLKIDRSFVHNLETDSDNMALSEAIIVMAHKLGLKVIAEGVETDAQRSLLAAAGCDYAQGFLFSRALPPQEFVRLLDKGSLH